MAHIAFPEYCKSVKTPSSSTTYSYVHIHPSSSKPTILFLHGFPSSSYDWRHQISHFASLGYGVLVPDLLGYGATDKPASPAAYKGKKMATEVVDILDHEKLDRVHAVAHDFGSHLLSKIVNYFPNRLRSCTFIAVPYVAPGGHFDLDEIQKISEKALGFEKYGYMRFMSREDSPQILEAHSEALTSLLYASDSSLLPQNRYPTGALEKYLLTNPEPFPSILSPTETATHNRIFSEGGYRGPTNWYRALVGNLNEADEKAALTKTKEPEVEASGTGTGPLLDPHMHCAVLAIDSAPGKATLPGFMEAGVGAFAADFRYKVVGTEGHWVQIESRDQVNAWLEEFFREVDRGDE